MNEAADGRLGIVAVGEKRACASVLEPGANPAPEQRKVKERGDEEIQTSARPKLVPQERDARGLPHEREESPVTPEKPGEPSARHGWTVAAGAAGLLAEHAEQTTPKTNAFEECALRGEERDEIRIQNEERAG